MRELVTSVLALAFCALVLAPADAAQQKRDKATCYKMADANPAYFANGMRTRAHATAVRRCMAGENI